jgi:hypothetical protein
MHALMPAVGQDSSLLLCCGVPAEHAMSCSLLSGTQMYRPSHYLRSLLLSFAAAPLAVVSFPVQCYCGKFLALSWSFSIGIVDVISLV